MLFLSSMSFLHINADSKDVIIYPEQKKQNTEGNQPPRAPMRIPQVSIDEYTLIFEPLCSECMVLLYQDGIIVLSGYVNENCEFQLPPNFSGSYILKFQLGTLTFSGVIEL